MAENLELEGLESLVKVFDCWIDGKKTPETLVARRIGKGLFLCSFSEDGPDNLVPVAAEDWRSLVVFDGTLSLNALPTDASVIFSQEIYIRGAELAEKPYRHFLMLPVGIVTIGIFDGKSSLSPVSIDVFDRDGVRVVKWDRRPILV